jgi:hypothetical protein
MAPKAASSTTAHLTTEQAAAAIVNLINVRPTSPRQDEIEAIVARVVIPAAISYSDEQAKLLEAIQECLAAEEALDEATHDRVDAVEPEGWDAADAHYTDALSRVGELAEQLAIRSFSDIVLLAQAAWCYVDKTADGNGIDAADNVEAAQARVVAAVLQLAGIKMK